MSGGPNAPPPGGGIWSRPPPPLLYSASPPPPYFNSVAAAASAGGAAAACGGRGLLPSPPPFGRGYPLPNGQLSTAAPPTRGPAPAAVVTAAKQSIVTVDKQDVQRLRKQNPGELRKLLRLLKRKKARKQRKETGLDVRAAAQAERERLKQCVQLRSKQTRAISLLQQRQQQQQEQRADREEGSETESEAESSDEETAGEAGSAAARRERRKQQRNKEKAALEAAQAGGATTATGESGSDDDDDEESSSIVLKEDVVVEYVPIDETTGAHAELAQQYADVFERFRTVTEEDGQGGGGEEGQDEDEEEDEEEETSLIGSSNFKRRAEDLTLEDEDEDESGAKTGRKKEGEKGRKTLSKKQQKLLQRPSVAELKQKTSRPDMVEVWDTTSVDPEFLVYLKGLRNTVPVPPHWSQKRRYLQWKRGFEKPPFKLPPHIEATKISEVRSALVEAESQKSLRQRMREKVRPKQNRLAIDYQVLHDCFFKHAVKPELTGFGDLYYEGKEFERKQRSFLPGKISDRLKQALGMGPLAPPPWLINMQRYGAPSAYPRLKIPGLNAPIPPGCTCGYHAGGWGKPPVDEFGQPLFSEDVDEEEALQRQQQQQEGVGEPGAPAAATAAGAGGEAAQQLWGELPELGLEDEDEDEEGDGGGEGALTGPGSLVSPGAETPFLLMDGAASVGGATSLASGLESPASSAWLDLRRSRDTTGTALGGISSASSVSSASTARKPYTILTPQEVPASQQTSQLFSVTHTYRMPGAPGTAGAGGRNAAGGAASISSVYGASTPVGSAAGARGVAAGSGAASSGAPTPFPIALSPATGMGAAGSSSVRSVYGASTPGGLASPYPPATGRLATGGVSATGAGLLSGAASAIQSVPPTPFGGGTASAGALTPARTTGFRTPAGAGVTVTLNPNEMEQEGVFTADVIRQQLRQHEEAAARAKQAAGQVDPADSRRRKGDEIRGTQPVSKSKKKKQFKF